MVIIKIIVSGNKNHYQNIIEKSFFYLLQFPSRKISQWRCWALYWLLFYWKPIGWSSLFLAHEQKLQFVMFHSVNLRFCLWINQHLKDCLLNCDFKKPQLQHKKITFSKLKLRPYVQSSGNQNIPKIDWERYCSQFKPISFALHVCGFFANVFFNKNHIDNPFP